MNQNIIELAEKHHGIMSVGLAVAVGTREAVRAELRSAHWESVGPAVYRLRGAPQTWEQRLTAVTLAAGPAAAASHRSAAGLLGIPGFGRWGQPEVTTPRTRRHRDPRTVVHRWRSFPESHVTLIDGIPTTRVARTLIDLAGVLHPRRTERAVDSCLGAGLVSLASLHATFVELAVRGRTGIAAMRAILGDRTEGYVAPESELEARFRALVRAAGLPEPVRQFNAGTADRWIGRVDFAYPPYELLIELDGRVHHSEKLDQEADEARDAILRAAGWHILRVTWHDITVAATALIARLRLALCELGSSSAA